MNTDTRPEGFEERLLSAILEDFDELTAEPARRRLPRPALPRLAWAGGLAAAAAMAILAVLITSGGSAPSGTSHAASGPGGGTAATVTPAANAPHFVDAAYVVKKVKAATSDSEGAGPIEFVSSHAPDSETGAPTWTRSWSYPGSPTSRIETLDPQGNPLTASLVTETKAQNESVLIDYAAGTWSTLVSPNQPGEGSEPSPVRAAAAAEGPQAEFQATLAEGDFRVAGHEKVDGRQAIELESTPAAFGEGTTRIWVDAQTYLPIREVATPPGAGADDPRSIRSEYRWIPANAESLAVLDPANAVPRGFKQVSLAEEDRLEAEAEGR
jgi:hypothetical protein